MSLDTSNINSLWAGFLIDELFKLGVDTYFVAPGSRCTPLTLTLANRSDVTCIQHVDERGLAYAAMGYGRACNKPAAWISTSGTAVANALPAVVEASLENIPLIIISADRPPELQARGNNQTINQNNIFGSFARQFYDLGCPDTNVSLSALSYDIQSVFHEAMQGLVHINAPYREPLIPMDDGLDYQDYVKESHAADILFTQKKNTPMEKGYNPFKGRGLIVCGRLDTAMERIAALALAEHTGYPVFADSLACLQSHKQVIDHFDLMLCNTELPFPETIIHLGGRVISKRLLSYIENAEVENYVLLKSKDAPYDPVNCVTRTFIGDVPEFINQLLEIDIAEDNESLLESFIECSNKISELIKAEEIEYPDSEAMLVRKLSQTVSDDVLFISNSMPIREWDMFSDALHDRCVVYANRGASGIDGNIATAVGIAYGKKKPVTCILGDLASLHDLNSLSLAANCPFGIKLYVINNDGGAIFSMLPIAEKEDVFEKWFSTPHGLNFESAAKMFNINYCLLEKAEDLNAFAKQKLLSRHTLIEIKTDKAESMDRIKKIQTLASKVKR